jgi:ferritin-like metal-binding protein YciE
MEGLIQEGEELLKEKANPDVLDAGLIAAAQKVEHYEIATYGTVRAYAERLGDTQAARLLDQTLEEEAQTNEKLTALAESHINQEAMV